MSKRITITLTDDEYAYLEQRASADRRSVRDMAARLVTQPGITIGADWTYRPPVYPQLWPPAITSGTTLNPSCWACKYPDSSSSHTCIRSTWTLTNACDARSN